MALAYTRSAPSPRYRDLLVQYQHMHTHGEQFQHLPPGQTFSGQSLPRHATAIKELIDRHGAKTILDYGAGKGMQYTAVRVKLSGGADYPSIPAYWGVDRVVCYDPGYEPFNKLPTDKFDGVVCTDVLEHCPEEDLPWIVEELFAFARKFVLANVACYPAQKRLSSGENAHCTVRPGDWWQRLIAPIAGGFPAVRYQFSLDCVNAGLNGQRELASSVVCG